MSVSRARLPTCLYQRIMYNIFQTCRVVSEYLKFRNVTFGYKILRYPLSVLQLTTWFDELKVELSSSEIADCVETGEQLIGQFEQQKEATTDACVNTITEGENILDQIRLVHFEQIIEDLC